MPTPVMTVSRICFALEWFATEAEAEDRAAEVRKRGDTYNGGMFHGMPCGREPHQDFISDEHGPLYAVSVA